MSDLDAASELELDPDNNPPSSHSKHSHTDFDTDETYSFYRQLMKDLQFVQMLADITYIKQLHIRGYFYDHQFKQYLKGLTYLLHKQHIKLIRYPQGLWNLKTFMKEGFIESIKDPRNFDRFIQHCLARNRQIRQSYS